MDTTALYQSALLTLIGMIVIFVFMGLMIVILNLFVSFAARFMPDKEETPADETTDTADKEKIVAAIAAALKIKND